MPNAQPSPTGASGPTNPTAASGASGPGDGFVRVFDAHEHNLAHVDVAVPRDALAVFTGVSGSGKSSLAFGTIYGEAQRRYLESVAPYARRLIQQAGVPHVGEITGLPPAVALEQRRAAGSSRSSVGTLTTLSNLLRMLFSRAGDYPPGIEFMDSDSFSPNTAVGACPRCHGLGTVHEVTEASLVPDPSLSIRQHAIAAWPGAWLGKNLRDIVATLGYDIDRPWRELDQADRDWILFTDDQPVVTVHPEREAGRIQRPYQGKYQSAKRYVLHTFADSKSATMRRRMERFLVSGPCPTCHGARLKPEALAVTFAGRTIAQLTGEPLSELAELLRPTAEHGSPDHPAQPIAADLVARVDVLSKMGIGYLSMDRATPTLSAGELQRLRLATQLRSGLFGVVYVLDEPSAGLHPADTEALLAVLDELRAAGNSLFVVEHDLDVVRRADWVVDVGPGPGEYGGRILYSGPVPGLADAAGSVTRRYLFDGAGERRAKRRDPSSWLTLAGVRRHNLADLTVSLPLGVFTAITGLSGAGKSTLLQVLAEVVRARLGDEPADDLPAAEGLDPVGRLVQVDQKPIGRTPRSNLATYTGLFDVVRKAFADTPQARERGYAAGRFSFNVPGGRCETCQGDGYVAVELLFLPGTYAPCPTCHGARYTPETLEITYHGRNIAEVLDLSVDAATEFFADLPVALRSLRALRQVGLGYLRLGQPATELSGGEAQRIKLATELQRPARGHTLYLLDEPTTGLHPADIELLDAQLHELVDAGNTVVVVEQDLATIAGADWVIDLGPGGGHQGGHVVATGTPEHLATNPTSPTAPYLTPHLP
ncbi:excinuclease ABC subunit UvrA [Actinocatenispora comari]|uniref:UvrABC system protein A n=1 Tax=Actinocatenispora comari TaxID=2807577 RepID=A0A8J4AIU2_9ACTN|nr:excinuclease ABC subunit UvrA [Actinocatenispora comari]GIL29463.1 excinuclease ABC subunit A [Actinocatenispora comari]